MVSPYLVKSPRRRKKGCDSPRRLENVLGRLRNLSHNRQWVFQGNLIPNHLQALKGLPGLSINKKHASWFLVLIWEFKFSKISQLPFKFWILDSKNRWWEYVVSVFTPQTTSLKTRDDMTTWRTTWIFIFQRSGVSSHRSIAQNVDASLFFGVCDACIALSFEGCVDSRSRRKSGEFPWVAPWVGTPPAWGFIEAKGKTRGFHNIVSKAFLGRHRGVCGYHSYKNAFNHGKFFEDPAKSTRFAG